MRRRTALATWDAIRASGGELPEHTNMGQLQCERR